MKNKQKKKKQIFSKGFVILSIVAMLISLCLTKPTATRTAIYFVSLFIMNKAFKPGQKGPIEIIFTILTLLVIYIAIDGIISVTFKRIPILSYNIVSTEKTRVYNSVGVRVWQCDKDDYKNIVVDPFYSKGYVCDADDIDPIPSNSFLNSIVENYDEYKNTYVKVVGKISRKNGQNGIEMQPYNTTDITINGYVEFASNITLRILFNKSEPKLDDYDVYDEITVVGIIKNMEQYKGKYVVYMSDTKISSSKNLNEYTITAVPSNTCSLSDIIYAGDRNTVYSYCLEDITVSFKNDNQYDLATALSSNKLAIEDLYKTLTPTEESDTDETVIYRFKDYSILVCDSNKSNKVVIGNKKLQFNNINCD